MKQIRIERPRAGREHPGVVRQRNVGKSDSETVAGRIRARRLEGCRRDRWPGPRWRAPADSRCSPARPGRWPWARPGSAPWHAATGRSADYHRPPAIAGWLRPWPGCHAQRQGLLDSHWEAWFSGLQVKNEGTQTIISGLLPDQPALHGLLAKIRDLGLCLISVRQLDPNEPGRTDQR